MDIVQGWHGTDFSASPMPRSTPRAPLYYSVVVVGFPYEFVGDTTAFDAPGMGARQMHALG